VKRTFPTKERRAYLTKLRRNHSQPRTLTPKWKQHPKQELFEGPKHEKNHSKLCPEPLKINPLNKKIKAFKMEIE